MERGGFPSFFIGGKMLTNLLCVVVGMILMWALNYVMALGHSVAIIKQTQQSCAALFTIAGQGLHEILELKYIAMTEAKRSEQNIVAQKYIDQINIDSVQKSIMRNYVLTFPKSYSHLMEYSTWEELGDFVDKTVKAQKEKKHVTK